MISRRTKLKLLRKGAGSAWKIRRAKKRVTKMINGKQRKTRCRSKRVYLLIPAGVGAVVILRSRSRSTGIEQ